MKPVQTVELPMRELVELLEVQLRGGGKAALTVTGSSMVPMLQHRRDQVWLTTLTRAPKKGDVILYRRESGRYVLHRVIRPDGPVGCLCCGDNDWKTELVRRTEIVGVVCEFRRKGKIYSVEDWQYRLYVRLWTLLFPLRRPILLVRRVLGRLKRFLKQNT